MINKLFCKAGCFSVLFLTKLIQGLIELSAYRSLKIIFDDWSLCDIWHRTSFYSYLIIYIDKIFKVYNNEKYLKINI